MSDPRPDWMPDDYERPTIWFVLICLGCTPHIQMPFDSAEARGRWASLHTAGTGHDKWIVTDEQATPLTPARTNETETP